MEVHSSTRERFLFPFWFFRLSKYTLCKLAFDSGNRTIFEHFAKFDQRESIPLGIDDRHPAPHEASLLNEVAEIDESGALLEGGAKVLRC